MTQLIENNWREEPIHRAVARIKALNGGHWPVSVPECERVAAGIHFRIRYYDRTSVEGCRAAFTSMDRHAIFLPDVDEVSVIRILLHELVEVVLSREDGSGPFHYVSPDDEFHRIARIVERRHKDLTAEEHAQAVQAARRIEAEVARLQERLSAEIERARAAERNMRAS